MKIAVCQDISCVFNEYDDNDMPIPTELIHVGYIASNKRDAWICRGCLDEWRDIQEEHDANSLDFDLGGDPFIETYSTNEVIA